MKTICLSRTDSIGDVILTLPMAGLIKKKYPNTKIIFLGKTYTKPIIDNCEFVDEFINWSELEKKTEIDCINLFKEKNIDWFFHVFPNRKIARIIKKAKIPERVGTSHRLYHWLTCNHRPRFTRKNSNLHESQLNLKLLTPILEDNSISLTEMQNYFGFKKLTLPSRLNHYFEANVKHVIFHPKSQGSAVEWGAKNFIKLVNLLDKEKYRVYICGTQTEKEILQDVLLTPLKNKVIDLTGQLSLSEYIAFIQKCDVLIAASTGPLHIAAVSGVKAIGLFSNKKPIFPQRWAPIGKNACTIINENSRQYTDPVKEIKEIKPELVFEEIKR